MNYECKIIPGAKKNAILAEQTPIRVYLTAPAADGKANKALISVLADFYKVRKRQITIIKGLKSRNKTINIGELL